MILVLSMIMTVIEGARQTTARIIAERAITTAMDSVLAGFYGPLMKEYHLLGFNISDENGVSDDTVISERIKDYVSYTINPHKDLNVTTRSDLYGISLESVDVINKARLMDYKGSLLVHEVTEYMKYNEVGNAAEALLEKMSLLEQPDKVIIVYEEKIKLEEELVEIDEGILALMKYLDGVSTGKKGLLRDKGGKLKTEKNFVKKILFETPTMESTGINNQNIFLALKDKYVNPSALFMAISYGFSRIRNIQNIIDNADASINSVRVQIEGALDVINRLTEELSGINDDDKEKKKNIMDQIKNIKKHISDLEDTISDIQKTKSSYIDERNKCIKDIKNKSLEIYSLLSGVIGTAEAAIIELDQIIKAAEEAKPKIEAYEEFLKKYKDELDEEIYENMEKELQELKKYEIDNDQGYDFLDMKNILNFNYGVLGNCIIILDEGYEALLGFDFTKAENKYDQVYKKLLTYNTDGLKLDYSSFVLESKDTPNFLEKVKDFVEEGITGLVVDPKDISKSKLEYNPLPTELASLSGELKGFSFSDLFKKLSIGNKNSGLGGLFSTFKNYGIGAALADGFDAILKRILVVEYIKDHFYEFTLDEKAKKTRKPSALNYEWEYLLYGNRSDKDNIESAIIRLLLLRIPVNFTSILVDKEKNSEAKALASLLVGFTGLPVLVLITQTILMLLLAFAASLVDVCALLKGKEVPIINKKIELSYADLLFLTRENIQNKAEAYKSKGMAYNDYLKLFLYITGQEKLSYRMMDLIQENIKLRYGVKFDFQNCVFGFDIEAKYQIKPIFTTFKFIQEILESDFDSNYTLSAGYSY